jgi:hypothetical protein
MDTSIGHGSSRLNRIWWRAAVAGDPVDELRIHPRMTFRPVRPKSANDQAAVDQFYNLCRIREILLLIASRKADLHPIKVISHVQSEAASIRSDNLHLPADIVPGSHHQPG